MVDFCVTVDFSADFAVVDEVHAVDQRQDECDVLFDEKKRNATLGYLNDRFGKLVLELG